MTIPAGYALITIGFDVQPALPYGAVITFGINNEDDQSAADVEGEANGAFFTDGSGADLYSSAVTSSFVRAKLGPDATGAVFEAPHTNVGTLSSSMGASAPAMLVRKNTDDGGRKNRGRFFIPGIPESLIDVGGQLTGGMVTGAQGRLDDFLTGLTTRHIPMVILHQDDDVTIPTTVTSLAVQATVATQRRRQRR